MKTDKVQKGTRIRSKELHSHKLSYLFDNVNNEDKNKIDYVDIQHIPGAVVSTIHFKKEDVRTGIIVDSTSSTRVVTNNNNEKNDMLSCDNTAFEDKVTDKPPTQGFDKKAYNI